ncbi:MULTISPECIES: restriction endonuclease subunit S [unclassified Micrococcus]|uniref:restriction endonuclease subunit S n=1 Tax=unclassified Micrococcus TaxID=2620948 RepID=UPI00200579DD|nr:MULTISPECIES: restriction endonuclease subunit S [unclassified Micrococcus]
MGTTSLRHLVRFGNGSDCKSVEAADGPYPVYGSGGEFARSTAYLHDGESVLFGRKGTVDRPLYVNGRFWTVDTMYYTVPGPRVEPRFLYYWATTIPFDLYSTNTALPSMTSGTLGSLQFPLIGREQQRQVADYLDRETATIDALIEKQGQMKTLLLERRRTAIDSCFPPGADTRLSNVLQLCQTGPFGTQLSASEYIEGGVPVINPTHIVGSTIAPNAAVSVTAEKADALSRHDLVAGDIVLGRKGEVDKSALVSPGHPRMLLGSDSMLLRVNGECADPRYLWWWLQSPSCHSELERLSVGSTVAGLNQRIISVLALPKPSLKEQREIADYLDAETAKIDALIAKAERFIELAQERRAALITAAVTGQIEIPTED